MSHGRCIVEEAILYCIYERVGRKCPLPDKGNQNGLPDHSGSSMAMPRPVSHEEHLKNCKFIRRMSTDHQMYSLLVVLIYSSSLCP